jgi:hypothetical protein
LASSRSLRKGKIKIPFLLLNAEFEFSENELQRKVMIHDSRESLRKFFDCVIIQRNSRLFT